MLVRSKDPTIAMLSAAKHLAPLVGRSISRARPFVRLGGLSIGYSASRARSSARWTSVRTGMPLAPFTVTPFSFS